MPGQCSSLSLAWRWQVRSAPVVPLSSSLPSSPAPPRPLLGHPPRSGITTRVLCRRAEPVVRAQRCSDGGSGCRSGSAVESAAGAAAAAAAAAAAGVHVGRCAGGPPAATHAAFSSLCACLCCWLLARVLPGLFWSRTAAVHNFSTCSHTCHGVGVHGGALCLGLCGYGA